MAYMLAMMMVGKMVAVMDEMMVDVMV